jgi:putative cardiolipin synthase
VTPRVPLAAILALAACLAGCAALPSQEGRPVAAHLADTDDTPLGRGIRAQRDAHPGKSGVHALNLPLDAFAARVLLMRAAARSLDIQYYIWHDDITGRALLLEARQAAERGVRVRLLVDDNGIAGLDADLRVLDAHPNAEVRLFNPFLQRGAKSWGYLTDFKRLNHRMHNKSLTADTQATIVGGRNVGDVYYGADSDVDFADLDVIAAGPVARDVARAFDVYWNSDVVYPAEPIIGKATPADGQRVRERDDAVRASPGAQRYVDAVKRADVVGEIVAGRLKMEWVPVRALSDPPAKAGQQIADEELLLAQLVAVMGNAQREIDLVSPYFVPGELGTANLAKLAARGVRVRVVTNSLSATDVSAVHAGYAKWRKELLRGGVRLYELKRSARADAVAREAAPALAAAQAKTVTQIGSSDASLHGKTFRVDGRQVFVGSMNLDPRSVRLNTEMGVVIDSPLLAGRLKDGLDNYIGQVAYELRLAEDGSLVWIEQTPAGELRHGSEPNASLGRRFSAWFLSLLPIDWLL